KARNPFLGILWRKKTGGGSLDPVSNEHSNCIVLLHILTRCFHKKILQKPAFFVSSVADPVAMLPVMKQFFHPVTKRIYFNYRLLFFDSLVDRFLAHPVQYLFPNAMQFKS
ncbi:MAG: hypothetical protein R6V54_02785, partial [Desulfobacteraceae bacterium]